MTKKLERKKIQTTITVKKREITEMITEAEQRLNERIGNLCLDIRRPRKMAWLKKVEEEIDKIRLTYRIDELTERAFEERYGGI